MTVMSTTKGILSEYPLIYYALRKVHRFFFDLGWKLYRKSFSDPGRHVKTLVSYAKEMINPKLVVDLGCGNGPYRQELSKLGERYFGCDLFRTDSVNLIADAHVLPFRDGSVPVVTVFQSLEHFHSPWLVMKEVERVLMKDGLVLITAPQYWPQHGHSSDYFRFTRNGLITLCESNNLEVVKCWSMGGPFLVLYHMIELNFRLNEGFISKVFIANPLSLVLDGFDTLFFHHQDKRKASDSVGWAIIARKQQ